MSQIGFGAELDSPFMTLRISLIDGYVDGASRLVFRGERRVRLTQNEVDVLLRLVQAEGVVSRQEINVDVLGNAPQVLTRAADNVVARLRKKLERDPAEPLHILTVQGVGYRWHSSDSSRTGSDGNLAVGRDSLIAELLDACRPGSLLVVHGVPRVGTSRVLREVTRRLPNPVMGCDLRHRSGLRNALCRTLECEPNAVESAIARLPSGVVWLDNLSALDPELHHLSSWGESNPRLTWLVTSRRTLDLDAAQHVRVKPLSFSSGLDYVSQKLSRLDVAARNEEVAPLVRACGGWMQALNQLVHSLTALTCAEVSALVGPSNASGGERHQLLEELWSGLLEGERDALLRLSAFAGPWDLELGRSMGVGGELVAQLVDSALVERAANASGFVVWPPLLSHLANQYHRGNKWGGIATTHARVVLESRANSAELRLAMGRLSGTLRAQLAFALARSVESALERTTLVAASVDLLGEKERHLAQLELARSLSVLGRHEEALAVLGRSRSEMPSELQALTLVAEADVRRQTDPRGSEQLLRNPLLQGNSQLAPRVLRQLGVLALEGGESRKARNQLQRAYVAAEAAGDDALCGTILTDLGNLCLDSDLVEAARCLERAGMLFKQLGDPARQMYSQSNLGFALHLMGDLDRAESLQREALAEHDRVGNRRFIGFARAALGAISLERGHLVDAEQHLLAAREILEEVDPTYQHYVEARLAMLQRALGASPEADAVLKRVETFLGQRRLVDALVDLEHYRGLLTQEPRTAFGRLGQRLSLVQSDHRVLPGGNATKHSPG
ncbi:MAG: winged helix-turn-helix domain-containing protein [Myxococcales bacterium]|nr:winged helix-turn-helix domain-containing protein [Myxococcales bacterium]